MKRSGMYGIRMAGKKIPDTRVCLGVLLTAAIMIGTGHSYGHGAGLEILPAQRVGDEMLGLKVESSQFKDPRLAERSITFTLYNPEDYSEAGETVFYITGERRGYEIFGGEFVAPDGVVVFDLLGGPTEEVMITSEDTAGFLESILGIEKKVVQMRSSLFERGGLYYFDVEVRSVDGRDVEPPVVWEVGLSMPDITLYNIDDPDFGLQKIEALAYYDAVENLRYDASSDIVRFEMPFEWNEETINQTLVVHYELKWSRELSDLMTSGFELDINGVRMDDSALNIDDFTGFHRVLHIILGRDHILRIHEARADTGDTMRILLRPSGEGWQYSTVTENGQFRIFLDTKPAMLKSGESARIFFDISDVFLKGNSVAADYEVSMLHDGEAFYSTTGTSSDSDVTDYFLTNIPEDVSGLVEIRFENVDGNSFAGGSVFVLVDRVVGGIPDWVKRTAGWWAEGEVSDGEFLAAISHMLDHGIIMVPTDEMAETPKDAAGEIPEWVKRTAGWWAEGEVSDGEFRATLSYLIERGAISASNGFEPEAA